MINIQLIEEIKKIKAIADVGLLYNNNEYDKERYHELNELCFKLLHLLTEHSIEALKNNFLQAKDYPTAKVDVRGLMLSADYKVLLVKESVDGKWSLPGGWADIGYSPKEVIIKEFREETGLDVVPETLLAVFDKRMHPHPPQPFYVYKMVFYCKATSFEINKGFDVSDVAYFNINDLPELSEDRILKTQVELLYNKVMSSDMRAFSD